MKKLYTLLLLIAATVVCNTANAQTVATGFTNNNGSGTVTFNLENTNNYDVVITGIEGAVGTSGTTTAGMWYKPSPLSGAPGAISSGNGWTLIATGTFTGVAVTTGTSTQTFLSNLTFILPANTTYRMAVCAYVGTSARQRYSTLTAGSYSAVTNGVRIISGTNISYGSGVPPTAPSIANRGWIGKVHFMPACDAPSGMVASNVTTTDADITWNAITGSLGYEYVLDQNPGNPVGAGTPTSATTYHASGLTLNTTYYLHVRNKCTNTFSGWNNFAFTTADAYCKPPVNILFSNITTTSADVLWSSMPTSDHYEYSYDLSSSPASASNKTATSGITATLTGLKEDTKYYFFVRSICLGGNDSSTWRLDSFVTKAKCKAPDVHVNNINTNNPDAWWYTIPSAVAYEYRVENTEFKPPFGTPISDTVLSLTLPAEEPVLYLHVRAKCNSQFTFSDWTTKALKTFNTSVINVNHDIAPEVYPNPANDYITIKNAANSTLHITDLKGSTVVSVHIAGNSEKISVKDLQPGIYVMDVMKENSRLKIKLVKQ